uniref:Uncharacterized protein n=1 Tax=Knipowitschia caucasica TaxID=637954 RepID=A0AAV2JVJ9_KNICA
MALLRAALVLCVGYLQSCGGFNLDVDKPSVFAGPEGSYFGFSVDFFKPSRSKYVVIHVMVVSSGVVVM